MRPHLRVTSIVLVAAFCPLASAQSGPRGAPSRFQAYNAYALDTLRIITAVGEYAVKCGDSAKHANYLSLYDRFTSVGIRARELLDRERHSAAPPQELERRWKEVARMCIELRREVDPGLVTWASGRGEPRSRSSDDWDLVTHAEMPDDVLAEIRRRASQEHPGDLSAQQDFVERQSRAYRQWRAYDFVRSAPFDVYQFIRDQVAGDYPGDYATQLHVLERQMEAYDEVRRYEPPAEMTASDLFRIKEKAAADYPYDLSTQLFVIKQSVDKYMQLRRQGARPDAIVRYILRR